MQSVSISSSVPLDQLLTSEHAQETSFAGVGGSVSGGAGCPLSHLMTRAGGAHRSAAWHRDVTRAFETGQEGSICSRETS